MDDTSSFSPITSDDETCLRDCAVTDTASHDQKASWTYPATDDSDADDDQGRADTTRTSTPSPLQDAQEARRAQEPSDEHTDPQGFLGGNYTAEGAAAEDAATAGFGSPVGSVDSHIQFFFVSPPPSPRAAELEAAQADHSPALTAFLDADPYTNSGSAAQAVGRTGDEETAEATSVRARSLSLVPEEIRLDHTGNASAVYRGREFLQLRKEFATCAPLGGLHTHHTPPPSPNGGAVAVDPRRQPPQLHLGIAEGGAASGGRKRRRTPAAARGWVEQRINQDQAIGRATAALLSDDGAEIQVKTTKELLREKNAELRRARIQKKAYQRNYYLERRNARLTARCSTVQQQLLNAEAFISARARDHLHLQDQVKTLAQYVTVLTKQHGIVIDPAIAKHLRVR